MTKGTISTNAIVLGDCLKMLPKLKGEGVDLVYIDPPFFTQKEHKLKSRTDGKHYSFDDKWASLDEYVAYIEERVVASRSVLKNTGVLFFHCDTSANFAIRSLLNRVFGESNFVSEIIWTYKRWSNSNRSLLPAHQTIFLFSKTSDYKFNHIYTDYSNTTNLEQILQKRARNENGTVVYLKDSDGQTVLTEEKKGVPLSDVWDIPFLNPKAKERCGYPTQKPLNLLERVIQICTDEGDVVLDPFCGSGTTLVAAKMLGRQFIGIDKSQEAVSLAEVRLEEMIKTSSAVLDKGRDSFVDNSEFVKRWLGDTEVRIVHRNAGIDCFYAHAEYGLIPIRIQRVNELLTDVIFKLKKSIKSKFKVAIAIKTSENDSLIEYSDFESGIVVIDHLAISLKNISPK